MATELVVARPVRPVIRKSVRDDRRKVLASVSANLFGAIDGLRKLSNLGCHQRNRLLKAQSLMEEAKTLVMQIVALEVLDSGRSGLPD